MCRVFSFDGDGRVPLDGVQSFTIDISSVVNVFPRITPSALELTVWTILQPHCRVPDGVSLVSAEGSHVNCVAWGVARERRVQMMLRRRAMAQRVEFQAGYRCFWSWQSLWRSFALLRRSSRGSLVIDVDHCAWHSSARHRDDEGWVTLLPQS